MKNLERILVLVLSSMFGCSAGSPAKPSSKPAKEKAGRGEVDAGVRMPPASAFAEEDMDHFVMREGEKHIFGDNCPPGGKAEKEYPFRKIEEVLKNPAKFEGEKIMLEGRLVAFRGVARCYGHGWGWRPTFCSLTLDGLWPEVCGEPVKSKTTELAKGYRVHHWSPPASHANKAGCRVLPLTIKGEDCWLEARDRRKSKIACNLVPCGVGGDRIPKFARIKGVLRSRGDLPKRLGSGHVFEIHVD